MIDPAHMIERLIPGVNRKFGEGSAALRQHLLRYRFAAAYVRAGDRVLDAGCGSGYGASILAGAGARVVGMDGDVEAIEYARRTYSHPNILWVCSRLENVPAPSESFDRIICFETIEHVKQPEKLVFSLGDILKETGVMICSAPVIPTTHFNRYHLHDFSAESFTGMFLAQGFFIFDQLIQEDTYLTLVIGKREQPDLEPRPINPLIGKL